MQALNHAGGVRGAQSGEERQHDFRDFGGRELALVTQMLREIDAVEELHHQVPHASLFADFEDVDDVGCRTEDAARPSRSILTTS